MIIVYDVEEKRVAKVCKFLRRYLPWIQNSVFEGELTEGQLAKVKVGLKKIIDEKADSILFYRVSSQKWLKRDLMGIEKNPLRTVI